MIKHLGEAAVSVMLASAGFIPFMGEWPEPVPSSAVSDVPVFEITAAPAPQYYVTDGPFYPVQRNAGPESAREDVVHQFGRQLEAAYGINPTRAKNFSGWIVAAVESSSIPKEVMASLIMSESSFRYKVTSSVGAVGPAQVRPNFWGHVCDGDLENDPRANIQCSRVVLETYLERCRGDMVCTLQTYNIGPDNMKKKEFEPAKRRYIAKINKNKAKLEKQKSTMLASH